MPPAPLAMLIEIAEDVGDGQGFWTSACIPPHAQLQLPQCPNANRWMWTLSAKVRRNCKFTALLSAMLKTRDVSTPEHYVQLKYSIFFYQSTIHN